MGFLSKREEEILLAIGSLGEDAYLVAIRKLLSEITGKDLSIGAVHIPLRRLEKAHYLKSHMGNATAVRGGRRKKIYRITSKALEALRENKRIYETLWAEFLKSMP
jgi:PadR family transcriptional regulator PadR